ncbi:MAG: cupredoxin domain-containing protein [Actinomycetota bacterium]
MRQIAMETSTGRPADDAAAGITWRRLLGMAAALDLALIVAGNLLFGPDPAFLALGGLFLLGWLLLRRRGRTGVVVAGLPALVISVMFGAVAPFLVTNPLAIFDREGGLFLGLLVAAFVGVISAVGALLEARAPAPGPRRAPSIVGGIAAGVLVALVAAGGIARLGFRAADARPGDLSIVMKDVGFSARSLDATGGDVIVHVANRDPTIHTFTIDGVVNATVPAQSQGRVIVRAAPGTYRYYCAVPGHAATMHGTLTIPG